MCSKQKFYITKLGLCLCCKTIKKKKIIVSLSAMKFLKLLQFKLLDCNQRPIYTQQSFLEMGTGQQLLGENPGRKLGQWLLTTSILPPTNVNEHSVKAQMRAGIFTFSPVKITEVNVFKITRISNNEFFILLTCHSWPVLFLCLYPMKSLGNC